MIEEKKVNFGGLSGVMHTPEQYKGTIILAHGLGSDMVGKSGMTPVIADLFAKQGFRVLRFDFTGCGKSRGDFHKDFCLTQAIKDLNSAIDFAGEDVGLFGISHGGLASIFAASNNPKVKCLVTQAAVSKPSHYHEGYVGREYRAGKISENFVKDHNSYDATEAIKNLPPLLAVHGTADETVGMDEADHLFNNAPEPKKQLLVPGAGHSIPYASEESPIFKDMVTWFKTYL